MQAGSVCWRNRKEATVPGAGEVKWEEIRAGRNQRRAGMDHTWPVGKTKTVALTLNDTESH